MTTGQTSLIRRGARRALAASGIVAALLYGWWQAIDAARTPNLPDVELGAPMTLGRVALTPLSLQVRESSGDGPPSFVLSATLENVTGETQVASFGSPFRLITVRADKVEFGNPKITLLRDRQDLFQLQPRMPEAVEIAWQLPKEWRSGEPLSLTFFRQQFKLEDNLYGRSSWLGYSPVARIAVTPETAP